MRKTKQLHALNKIWLQYEYKHTTLALAVLILFIIFFDSALIVTALGALERLGYIGAFIAGLLSTSFFTTAPAIVTLLVLAQQLDPFAMAIVAGSGAMIGDWLLLLFFEDKVGKELRPLLRKLHIHQMVQRLRYKYTAWILWVVGIVSLATPLPDEIGVALLGMSNIKPAYMLGIAFITNTFGILVLVLAARALS
jgi:membrane protein YqaA with SNARE-associated domain